MSALTAYKFFDATGTASFSLAAHNFATSLGDRRSTPGFLAAGFFCKIISMIPFYSYADISQHYAHPISGISFPALTGIITANLASLAGDGPVAKPMGRFLSAVAGFGFEWLNVNIVSETPSTFWCANAKCVSPDLTERFFCDIDPSQNKTNKAVDFAGNILSTNCTENNCIGHWKDFEGRIVPIVHVNKSNFPPNCTESRCSLGGADQSGLPTLTAVFMNLVIAAWSVVDIDRYRKNSLSVMLENTENDFNSRFKIIAKNTLFQLPILCNLAALTLSKLYQSCYTHTSNFPLQNAPYLMSIAINTLIAKNIFCSKILSNQEILLASYFTSLALNFLSQTISQSTCSHIPPPNLPAMYQVVPLD